MKLRALTITIVVLVTVISGFAQDHKLVQFQMALLRKGPKWDSMESTEKNQILHQHLRNVIRC